MTTSRKKLFAASARILVRVVIPLGLIVYLARFVVVSASGIPAEAWRFDWRFFLLSLAGLAVTFLVNPLSFMVGLRCFEPGARYRKAFVIMHLSGLLKYIPGKIWQLAGAIYISKTEDIRAARSVPAIAMTQILSLLSGLLLSSGVVVSAMAGRIPPYAWLLPAAGLACVLAALWPPAFRRLHRLTLLLMKQEAAVAETRYGWRELGTLFAIYCLNWVLFSLSFFCLARAFHAIPAERIAAVADVFIATYVLGYAAVFAPGGLGVREGAMTWLLGMEMPYAVAGVISLVSRLWIIAAEAAFALAAMMLAKKEKAGAARGAALPPPLT